MDEIQRERRSRQIVPVYVLLFLAMGIDFIPDVPYRSWIMAAMILSACALLLRAERINRKRPPDPP